MTINEIAKKLLDMRETRMTGYIMSGVLREELGFEGYGEALRRRWIEADTEQSGMVTVTNNLGMVEEIRALAAECKSKCGKCNKAKCDCPGRCQCDDTSKCTCESVQPLSETAHFFAQAHAFRRNADRVGEEPVNEVATLGLGRTGDAPAAPVPGLGASSAAPPPSRPATTPASPTARPAAAPLGLGADVAVYENGREFVGKISKALPGDKFEVSFAGEKPAAPRAYDKSEVKAVAASK